MTFGVPPELTGEGVEPGVKEVFEATLKLIEDLGGELMEVGLPHSPHGIAAYYVIAPGRGQRQPGPLRRRALRARARATATCSRSTRRPAPRASATR